MGCEGVELCGLFGTPLDVAARVLRQSGLVACSAHVALDDLEQHLPREAERARTLGFSRLVVPWIEPPRTLEQAKARADRIDRVAEQVARAGLSLGYHNHDFEFADLGGGRMWDCIAAIAPERLFLEPDLGWVWHAGLVPCEFLKEHRGRCPLVHIKDFRSREGREFCPVGEGAIPYGVVVAHALWEGAEWLIAEQDEPGELSELEAAQRCVRTLRELVGSAVSGS